MSKKVVWISGASSGIGRALAIDFAKAGNIVAVTARRKPELEKLVKDIKSSGGEATAFVCNIMSEQSVFQTAKKITEKYGIIDCLINNAGATVFKSFMDTKITDFDTVVETNLRGAFLCIKSILPQFIKNRNGIIINILSVAANTTFENSAAYAASKAGLLAMSNSLRAEVRKYKIKICNVLPGAVETEMWDIKSRKKFSKKMMQPEDIGKIVLDIFNQPERVHIEDIIVRPLLGDV